MEMIKNFIITVLFIFLTIAGISAFIFIYSQGVVGQTTLPAPDPVIEPPPEPVFDAATLDWEQVVLSIPWQGRDSHAVVVYKDKLWLMGGLDANGLVIKLGLVQYEKAPHFSDVWSSEDGINWIQVVKESPWQDRRSIQVVNFKGKMWLMGGWGPKVGCKNDVWSSENGINWTKEIEHAAWPAREGHQLVVFQNKMWLMGGVRYDTHKLFNDVWYSEDGINWQKTNNDPLWTGREDTTVVVFKDKIWVLGGMDKNWQWKNDVWFSTY